MNVLIKEPVMEAFEKLLVSLLPLGQHEKGFPQLPLCLLGKSLIEFNKIPLDQVGHPESSTCRNH